MAHCLPQGQTDKEQHLGSCHPDKPSLLPRPSAEIPLHNLSRQASASLPMSSPCGWDLYSLQPPRPLGPLLLATPKWPHPPVLPASVSLLIPPLGRPPAPPCATVNPIDHVPSTILVRLNRHAGFVPIHSRVLFLEHQWTSDLLHSQETPPTFSWDPG